MPADEMLKEKKLPKAKPTSGMQMCRVLCVGMLNASLNLYGYHLWVYKINDNSVIPEMLCTTSVRLWSSALTITSR